MPNRILAENDGGGRSLSVDGKDRVPDFPGHPGAVGEREDPCPVRLDADSFQTFFGDDGVNRSRIHQKLQTGLSSWIRGIDNTGCDEGDTHCLPAGLLCSKCSVCRKWSTYHDPRLSCGYCARMVLLSPPRAVKVPVTMAHSGRQAFTKS